MNITILNYFPNRREATEVIGVFRPSGNDARDIVKQFEEKDRDVPSFVFTSGYDESGRPNQIALIGGLVNLTA
ncbi:hypothetical protein COU59_02880 [Candidatus Pacearchaeota archaeon CG10_big_fil_rev_8_21_14_0_10_34_12]|nr:MAG: hypothetical protein COU59_02880 [Candidatus Pacearchaeota archaeon CG10_big_fil_rev_8_21_14_0_10_34_12]